MAERHDDEAAGVILGGGDLVWIQHRDCSPSHFAAHHRGWPALLRHAVATIHTHPSGTPIPSHTDMVAQRASAMPAIVVPRGSPAFGFGPVSQAPFRGRPFRWGVYDCYELARSWFASAHGVELPAVPRCWGFWKGRHPEDLFGAGFRQTGFQRVSDEMADAEPGDGLVFRLGARVWNHCGIYLGRGLMLHHPASGEHPYDPTHVSRREPMARWREHPHEVWRLA